MHVHKNPNAKTILIQLTREFHQTLGRVGYAGSAADRGENKGTMVGVQPTAAIKVAQVSVLAAQYVGTM